MNCGIPYCMGTARCTRHARLPGEQPDPRLERSRLSRRLARTRSTICTRPTISRNSPAASARRRARPSCTLNLDRDAGHHQDDRMRDRRPRLGGRLDRARAAVAQDRQEGLGHRLGPGRHGLRAAARARRPRRAPVREVRAAPAACSPTAFPTSRWRSTTSHGASRRWRPRASSFHYGAHVGVNMPVERVTEGFDAVVLTGGAEASRDLPIPGRELGGIHFAMDYLPQQNRRIARRAGRRRAADPRRRASTSWSSAAATPAPTASAPRSARARSS